MRRWVREKWGAWYLKAALLGFAAMCLQDVLGTCMVVFEAHLNALLAGLCDDLGWYVGLVCSALALSEIFKNGWRTRKAITIIVAVSLANFAGTILGVILAGRMT